MDDTNLIFGHKLHICTPYRGKRFFDPSDSYFLFADFVDFYTQWTYILYMPIFSHIFLSNYWWQKSDIWSQASYRYTISLEAFFDPSDSYFLFAEERGYHKWALAHSSSCFHLVTHCFLSFCPFTFGHCILYILWFMTADFSFCLFYFWSLVFSCTYIFVCTYLTTYSLFYICCIYKDVTWLFDLMTHYELIYIIVYISYHIDIFYLVFVIQFFHVFWIKTSLL